MSENEYWTNTKASFENGVDLNVFKTWDIVKSVPIYFPYQFENHYGNDLIRMYLNLMPDQQEVWRKVLKEPFLGHTDGSYNQVRKFVNVAGDTIECTPWTLKCGHHVLTYLSNTHRKLEDYEQIVEFGPGIGETCRIINDLGYKGNYFLYDLPEVLRISAFYNAAYPNVHAAKHFTEIPNDRKTLFIATWSISEVPFSYRDEVFTRFKNADFLIIYQHKAFEYDNVEYFNTRFKEITGKETKLINIDWLDHIAEGNKYLFNI